LNSDNSSNLSITSKSYLMNNISLSSLKEKGDRSSINSMLSQKNNMNLEIKSTIRHDSANKIQNKYNQELKQVNIENDYSDIKNIEKIDKKNDKQEIFMLNYKNLTDLEKNSVIKDNVNELVITPKRNITK